MSAFDVALAGTAAAGLSCGVQFIAPNGGGVGVRLREALGGTTRL